MGNRLTKLAVERAEPGEKPRILWDTDIKGFGCKITPTGNRIYFLYYRTHDGQQRRPTIGRHGSITCEHARRVAKEWLADVVKGGDPSGSRQNAKAASTINDLCDRYIEEHAEIHNRPRTVKQVRRIVETKIKPKIKKAADPESDRHGPLEEEDIPNLKEVIDAETENIMMNTLKYGKIGAGVTVNKFDPTWTQK